MGMPHTGMTRLFLLLVVAASLWAGIALDRAGWKYRKQLWQFQGAATGFVAGFLLGRSRLI
ncbi:putative membrane protein [Synechococcus sp. RS9907]|nr:putative membrane protein [Synechococcus sp. RS9907]